MLPGYEPVEPPEPLDGVPEPTVAPPPELGGEHCGMAVLTTEVTVPGVAVPDVAVPDEGVPAVSVELTGVFGSITETGLPAFPELDALPPLGAVSGASVAAIGGLPGI